MTRMLLLFACLAGVTAIGCGDSMVDKPAPSVADAPPQPENKVTEETKDATLDENGQ